MNAQSQLAEALDELRAARTQIAAMSREISELATLHGKRADERNAARAQAERLRGLVRAAGRERNQMQRRESRTRAETVSSYRRDLYDSQVSWSFSRR